MGIDIFTISKLLNHSDIKTTVRYLSYNLTKNGRQAVEKLEKVYKIS
jgi:site-specific recombinase XerD